MSYLARANKLRMAKQCGWKEKEAQVCVAVLERTPGTKPAQANPIRPFHPSTEYCTVSLRER